MRTGEYGVTDGVQYVDTPEYLRNRSTLDIGVLGYIGIVYIRKTLPKSRTFLLGQPLYIYSNRVIISFFSYGTLARFRVMTSPYGTSRSHSDTPQSVGHLWTSDRPVVETSHNTQHSPQTSLSRVGFEPATPASEWQQTHALDRAATGIGTFL